MNSAWWFLEDAPDVFFLGGREVKQPVHVPHGPLERGLMPGTEGGEPFRAAFAGQHADDAASKEGQGQRQQAFHSGTHQKITS